MGKGSRSPHGSAIVVKLPSEQLVLTKLPWGWVPEHRSVPELKGITESIPSLTQDTPKSQPGPEILSAVTSVSLPRLPAWK